MLTYEELFKDFIGQTDIKHMLYDMYVCKEKINKTFPHTLFIASAGQGKTMLSKLMCKALCAKPLKIYAPAISSWEDMKVVLDKITDERNVLFIDEVHALPTDVQEMMYTLMSNYKVYNKKTGQYIKFPPFTLFAATTDPQYMLRPFMDRFVNTMVFTKYSKNDMIDLFKHVYNPAMFSDEVIEKFVALSHYTPRKFHSLVTRLDYYVDARGLPPIVDTAYFNKFLSYIGVDDMGFNALQRQYVSILKALKSPASLLTLANLMELKQEVITQIVEPDVIASGLVSISSSGRKYVDTREEVEL